MQLLPLGPLSAAALAELTRQWTAWLPETAFVDWLQNATAGNPLAVRETLRLLRDQQPAGSFSVPQESEAAPVRALILQRIERLGPQSKRVLEAACVCSAAFSVRQLSGTTALDEWTCLEALEDAVSAGLLEVDGGLFHFSHDLIRRALLSSLSSARAGLLHRHMASVLERSGGAPERVAQHLEAAGEDASAVVVGGGAGGRAGLRLPAGPGARGTRPVGAASGADPPRRSPPPPAVVAHRR